MVGSPSTTNHSQALFHSPLALENKLACSMKYFTISHYDSSNKFYLFQARYLHKDIFRYLTTHSVISRLYCASSLPEYSSYSNVDLGPGLTSFLGFYSYLYSSGAYPARLEQLL